jgi:cytochrome c-type biogenesis protein CcmH
MARQMRDLIRERLAAGDRPEQVMAYFVQRYGEWVLLAPPARGLNLLLWLAPFGAVVVGLALVVTLARRWRQPPARWSRRPLRRGLRSANASPPSSSACATSGHAR